MELHELLNKPLPTIPAEIKNALDIGQITKTAFENGLFMISRFWLGKTMKNPLLRKLIITEDMARSMAEHCCVEYRNLQAILPVLYAEYQ